MSAEDVRVWTDHGDAGALLELVELHAQAGGYWFSPSTMRFFQSRVETGLLGGDMFVTSEQQPTSRWDDEDHPRLYTVRRITTDDPFMVTTVGDFQEHDTIAAALGALARAALA